MTLLFILTTFLAIGFSIWLISALKQAIYDVNITKISNIKLNQEIESLNTKVTLSTGNIARLEELVSYLKNEIKKLEESELDCASPDIVRARLRRLFSGPPQ